MKVQGASEWSNPAGTEGSLRRESNQSLSAPGIPAGKTFAEGRDGGGIFGDTICPASAAPKPRKVKGYSDCAEKPELRGTARWRTHSQRPEVPTFPKVSGQEPVLWRGNSGVSHRRRRNWSESLLCDFSISEIWMGSRPETGSNPQEIRRRFGTERPGLGRAERLRPARARICSTSAPGEPAHLSARHHRHRTASAA